jgi:hypothetical protein
MKKLPPIKLIFCCCINKLHKTVFPAESAGFAENPGPTSRAPDKILRYVDGKAGTEPLAEWLRISPSAILGCPQFIRNPPKAETP